MAGNESDTVARAEKQLDQAIKLDPSEPLAAAELYVVAIKLLQQARRESKSDTSRLGRLEASAKERFYDCERRVRSQQSSGERFVDSSGEHPTLQTQGVLGADSNRGWGMKEVFQSVGNWFRPAHNCRNKPSTSPRIKDQIAGPSFIGAPVVTHSGAADVAPDQISGSEARKQVPASPSAPSCALRGVDRQLARCILDEVVDNSPGVKFDDIAGLAAVKAALQEAVILPNQRPDLFTGIRSPPRGILLFGLPGTGKTLLAKALATESGCKFLSISASSLTSKWMGQGEKLVRALFAVAAELAPSIIFIDEVDSILSARCDGEHEASRRIKTEFLVQFDGVQSAACQARLVVVAATNRPQDLDEAARRRFTKRHLVPLPELATRMQLVGRLLQGQWSALSESDLRRVGDLTAGYSGSDLAALCKEAAMAPLRELGPRIQQVRRGDVRPVRYRDVEAAVSVIRPSVSRQHLAQLDAWNDEFGSNGGC